MENENVRMSERDDGMKEDVTEIEEKIVIQNYYQYYRMFGQSGIVNIHEGPVCWMMPKEGEKGPSLAFGIHLNKETAEKEVQALIEEIRKGKVPQLWHITPDSTPENIIEILENNGFQNLSAEASGEEPTMLLNKGDFQPYMPISDNIVCHKVKSKEEFKVWIDVVNTALHGWDMIDAEHYYNWVNNERMSIYLGEIDGLLVSTAATIQNGNVASLEFVSTLENYRRRKIASTVCSKALEDLFEAGVQSVSLGACGESAYLYRRLGFHNCFNNIIGIYDIAK
ncbi:MAG: GNAT family N-acetyltransferase [Lachnospiraceae bacterium]|nr:GNAT family N-acetyltransferase [Lachnospiraceae bacterium]